MPSHTETRRLPYTPEQMYDLVADVGRYPEFLPWCVAARVRKSDETEMTADLAIGFKIYRERFTSHIKKRKPDFVEVNHADGPFRYLKNYWRFRPMEGDGVEIDFMVDFEFRSAILQRAISALFAEAVRRMVGAFEARAAALYGPKASPNPAA